MKDNILEEMYRIPAIREVLDHPAFLSLGLYYHHGERSRLIHVISVAEMVFIMSRIRGLDTVSATRAALLHDFYFYDRSMERRKGHWRRHPRIALENSLRYFTLNEIERDAIEHHMWPITPRRPLYRESRLVSLADKTCTLLDARKSAGLRIRGRGRIVSMSPAR